MTMTHSISDPGLRPTPRRDRSGPGGRWLITQLQQENARLKQINQLYKDMIAFTGHEWRNELSILNLNISQLELTVPDGNPQTGKALERLYQSSMAMRRIAANYLNWARLQQGSLTIHPKPIYAVGDMLDEMRERYAERLLLNDQTLRFASNNPDRPVWADADLLFNTFDNLIHNAIKYGAPGGDIVVRWHSHDFMDEFSVWNSGPGLTPEQLQTATERFRHVSSSPTPGSSGIGLYLVNQIVTAHGGTLRCLSKPGAWANFIFTLPHRDHQL